MSAALAAGEKVQVSANTTDGEDGNWYDATVAGTQWLAQAVLSAANGGENTLYVRTIDAAGNVTFAAGNSDFADATGINYTLDSTRPTASVTFATTVVNTDNDASLEEGETVTVKFSEAIDVDTLIQGGVFATGALTSVAEAKLGTGYSVAAVNASNGLATSFTITLGAGPSLGTNDSSLAFAKSKVVDAAGNTPANNVGFTTPTDITSPAINSNSVLTYDPLLTTATAVAAGTEITIRFNEVIDVSKLTLNSITVNNGRSLGNTTLAAVSPSNGYAQEFKLTIGSTSDLQLGVGIPEQRNQ